MILYDHKISKSVRSQDCEEGAASRRYLRSLGQLIEPEKVTISVSRNSAHSQDRRASSKSFAHQTNKT